jgi:hypothetical protein
MVDPGGSVSGANRYGFPISGGRCTFLVDSIADFSIDYTRLGLLIGLYLLPGIIIAYPGGLLGQHFGDKRIAVSGLVLMVASGRDLRLPWYWYWLFSPTAHHRPQAGFNNRTERNICDCR